MAKRIVEEIQNLDPPGRFLIEDVKSTDEGNGDEKEGILGKMWIVVEKEKAVDKVMHRLRERDKTYAEVSSQMQQEQQARTDISKQLPQEQLANSGPRSLLAAGLGNEQPANSGGPSFLNAGLRTALPPDQLAYVLQNMQQSGGGVGNALSNELMMANILQNMQRTGQGGNFLSPALAGQTPQQICIPQQHNNNEAPSNQLLGQPIQQMNNQQSALHQLLQQHSMQQNGMQTTAGNALANSQSVGNQVLNAQQSLIQQVETQSNVGNALNPQSANSPALNTQQGSIQQVRTQSNVGNALVCSPSAASQLLAQANSNQSITQMDHQHLSGQPIGKQSNIEKKLLDLVNSGANPLLLDMANQVSGNKSSFALMADAQVTKTRYAQTNAGQTLDNSAHSSALMASPLSQAVPADEQARDLNCLAIKVGFAGETLTIEQKASESSGKTLTVERTASDHVMEPLANNLALGHNQKKQKSQQQFRVVTLREWIDKSMPRSNGTTTPGHLTTKMSSYIKLAIPIALKLTEFLIETENLSGADSMASLDCKDLLVRLQHSYDVFQNQTVESVDRVEVKSRVGDDKDPVANLPPLYSLGLVLYEVFSSQSGKDAASAMAGSLVSVKGLSLSNKATGFDRPAKKSQPNFSLPRDNVIHDAFIAKLELLGIPRSLCALVGNLLDCVHGDLRGDEAYRSLADVHTDLRLMRDNPARFLDDIPGGTTSFEIGAKFYGRKDDIASIGESYQQHLRGGCGGIIVYGGAGVGKSVLVLDELRTLASQTNSHFLEAKFEQNEGACPLATIGAAFNSLCDMFVQDATQSQLDSVATFLHGSLGDQTALLASVLPSLTKFITCSASGASNMSFDPAASMQFLFRKFLEALSKHRRVLLFFDDLQFADPSSRLLISSILSNTKESSHVFFASCYRDDDIHEDSPFAKWLSSTNDFPLATMELKNISIDAVNELVSESLHLSPRITRPLASILYQKTRGNPVSLAISKPCCFQIVKIILTHDLFSIP